MNTCSKYWWVYNHPKFNKIGGVSIEFTPQMVNPTNNVIEDYSELNTKLQWWVELSYEVENDDPVFNGYAYQHAWRVDTGADTIEECVDNLYELVLTNYGEYLDEK